MTPLTASDIGSLTRSELTTLAKLRLTKAQDIMGKSFRESLDDWRTLPPDQRLGLCFQLDQPIGLVVFKRHDTTATMHGLKIALAWQGKGLAHEAMTLGLDWLKHHWPDIERLELVVDVANLPAIAVYKRAGLRDIAPPRTGSNGPEHHMGLPL